MLLSFLLSEIPVALDEDVFGSPSGQKKQDQKCSYPRTVTKRGFSSSWGGGLIDTKEKLIRSFKSYRAVEASGLSTKPQGGPQLSFLSAQLVVERLDGWYRKPQLSASNNFADPQTSPTKRIINTREEDIHPCGWCQLSAIFEGPPEGYKNPQFPFMMPLPGEICIPKLPHVRLFTKAPKVD